MQYLSPSTFSGETLSAPLDKKAIQLGRKKLFAELELSGESAIELHGKPFTKNDIIKYFDDLLKEDALAYHSAVGDDQVLLGFLEHARMGRKEMFQNNPLYKDEQFIHWISPYFCNSFIAFMDGCFLEPDEDGLTSLLNNRLLMTPGDLEKSWEAVSRIIMNDISTLQSYHAQDKKKKAPGDVPISLVSSLMEFGYIRMIQLLPQNRFASIRDKYAHCMLNACIDVFNSHVNNRSNARTWLENAELLAVSQEVKKQIKKKLEEMEAAGIPEGTGGNSSSNSSESSSAAVFKFILFALIIIIKLATCNSGSGSSYNYQAPVTIPKSVYDEWQRKAHSAEPEIQTEDIVTPGPPSMDTVTFTHKVKRRSKHK
jgi:hypothetical protein